jgi:hypothetical protein
VILEKVVTIKREARFVMERVELCISIESMQVIRERTGTITTEAG